MKRPAWPSEAAMCAAFREYAEKRGWIVFAEQGGVDFVLEATEACDCHDVPAGFQIAVEAKLSTSFEVLAQAVLAIDRDGRSGPDEVAVLVPGAPEGFVEVAQALGIGVFVLPPPELRERDPYTWKRGRSAHFYRPWSGFLRVDMHAGQPGPRVVSPWKIAAVRLCMVGLERPLTREDFQHSGVVKIRTFVDRGWIRACQHEGRRAVAYSLVDGAPGRPDLAYPEIVAALREQQP